MAGPRATAPPVSAYQPLVLVLAAVALGIVCDRFFSPRFGLWVCAAIVTWGIWLAAWRRGATRPAQVALALSLAATGGAWHHARWSLVGSDELGLFAREAAAPLCLEAVAQEAPRRMPNPPADPLRTYTLGPRDRLELAVERVRDGAHWRAATGAVTLLVDGELAGVQAGDRIQVFGRLAQIGSPLNPGEFDYAAFARSDRHWCSLRAGFPEAVSVVRAAGRGQWRQLIDRLRSGGVRLLDQSLAPRQAGLANAMFLGVREDLDAEDQQAFLETGTMHLLVISGLNVGILAACLLIGLRVGFLPAREALAVVVVLTLLYALVTDAQPPVVRATIMVIVGCLGRFLGRPVLEFNVWAAAALVVLIINPSELFHAGTQLSFLCVAVLIWLNAFHWRAPAQHPLDRLIAATRPWPIRLARRLGQSAGRATLASALIWVVVCPLVMARFHLVSPAAVVLGPLVALPVTLAMASGFGLFALGGLLPGAATLCGRVCNWNLAWIERSIAAGRDWPGGHFWVAGPADWWLAGFYLGLAVWAAGLLPLPRRWCLALLAGWCGCGFGVGWIALSGSDRLECTFVSVGHGSAVVCRLPDGRTLLYDAGRMGSPGAGERAISAVLWSRGIRHLDAVVLSHADTDHYNALPGLLRKFSVGAVYVSPVMFEQSRTALQVLQKSIEAAGVPIREIAAGDRLRGPEGCLLEVTHPPRHGVVGSDNANSIVLAIAYQGRRILLTGDLESPGLEDVLAEQPCHCDVLMAPHHGSRYSDPPGIAAWSTPDWVVVSGSETDRWPQVERAYSARGCQLLHTATTGAIRAEIRPGRLAISCFRTGAQAHRDE